MTHDPSEGVSAGLRHFPEHRGYMEEAEVTGLLAIKRGRVVLERYARGNDDSTVWASRSMAKSITSLMIGAAIQSKHIRSVDDPVSLHVPELEGTFYHGVTLRHCLQMTSGIPYSEDYQDRASDVARLQACTVEGRPGAFLDFLRDLCSRWDRKTNPPRSVFNYCSADSVVLGLALERATGEIAPVRLEHALWRRLGMERDAFWNLEAPGGSAFTASGFGATLRDYGGLALFVLGGARLPDGTRIVPEGLMQESLARRLRSTPAVPMDSSGGSMSIAARCPTRSERARSSSEAATRCSTRWAMQAR